MGFILGIFFGTITWFIVRCVLTGFFTVEQNERAVITTLGRAQRIEGKTTLDLPLAEHLSDDHKSRYAYPQVRVIGPGGPYIKMPWQKVHKVSIAIETASIAYDPEDPTVNQNWTVLEAVSKDQLNIGVTGQLRFKVSERNLYAYLFGVKNPVAHIMGYFVSILRERIANFQAKHDDGVSLDQIDDAILDGETPQLEGVSINDLRKNLNELNEQMNTECLSSAARYGIELDASLITGIDPPADIDSALAAINTAHNEVSADISLAQAEADQKIEQSKRAVEIQTMRVQAEVEPLRRVAGELLALKQNGGPASLQAYLRNVKLQLFRRARRVISEIPHPLGMTFITTASLTFFGLLIGLPIFLGILKYLCWFTTVNECRCKVFVLFGKVIGVIDEPGLHITPFSIGPGVLLVPFFGKVHTLDLRLDQRYLRSRPVNSEEGTPVGLGVWYEMRVSDPVAYLFENTDPEGSLQANVTNTTVRSLSNMPLNNMMQNRHQMSREVRAEVSPKSESWGYSLGSVYIRKVHFRDAAMIHQIEQKVVNRLRQVTSAIRQAGDNQVDIIKSRAEREASIEFAKAQAVRPRLVGDALREIGRDPEVVDTLFAVLETQEILAGSAEVIMMPAGSGILPALEAEREVAGRTPPAMK